mmetsp:Transcript_10765/g.19525  ORF Transcript_10765/g.19525 Transcript_10765/m.19525 type:complete len:182 (-) Transcript_10765:264-809(-)
MSFSLMSRQLVQRTVAPWLASARATPVAASQFGNTPLCRDNLQMPLQINTTRNFSSMQAKADDDGGPVNGSFTKMTNKQLADMSTIPGWNLVHNPPRRNPRGALVGTVVSDKMNKTVNIAVDRFKLIPKYRKRWRFTKKFMAHDEQEVCNMGDLVMIVPCQKISKHKHFMVREIIRPKGQL